MPTPLTPGELRARLQDAFRWRTDRGEDHRYADVTGWWRDPGILHALGPALADLFVREKPSLVAGVEAHGFLLGPLVALALDVGFVAIRKRPEQAADSDVRPVPAPRTPAPLTISHDHEDLRVLYDPQVFMITR